ncbi:DapH/DapD/GlmU-related protein [Methanotrichaceae archaeon M04Ac]|jgi:carbonic anhydrase/acetyltransferase-like protein (isoleucine patch superfamily)|uniref:DapH/DapD/GlmU-related protein n=1 Tax=Candidatus Methanocrinis alkalitolerans TaxID=3033395 RepID=A0ABT5XBQ8_9EURY|nr:DapH/DapD/GlmU-related protein [Candidatus Methanocrinis alkalitolerans]MCR3883815.1 carbonate dehydratase [Methanothrix sp.]MDF0592148.1 DapH/DapD/GlmU-related protein [Candidatus Methanocrinis alkalitolerans]
MIRANPITSWNDAESMATVAKTAYVDPAATVIGDVRIGERVYIGPGASVRADEATPIIIGDESNVQDGAVFHGLEGTSIKLGRRVSIAHGAVVHGPLVVGDGSFVGFNAVVHASTLGNKCFVGHLALVVGVTLPDGSFVPPGSVVDSQEKADKLGPVPESLKGFNDEVVKVNTEFAEVYLLMDKGCKTPLI